MDMPVGQIVEGHVLDVLKGLSGRAVNAIITSPPYWSLRAYNTEPVVWGGRQGCQHNFILKTRKMHSGRGNTQENGVTGSMYSTSKNIPDRKIQEAFCSKCGAWRGELGLEPTPDLYIEHLMAVFDELKRVLRDDGICFVNIADSYSSTPNARSAAEIKRLKTDDRCWRDKPFDTTKYITAKSLCLIPERFVLAMQQHGWIVRCKIVWAKGVSFCETYSGSCMPDSAKDRPNKNGYEMVYMFTKSSDMQFWTHGRKRRMTGKKPKPDYIWVHKNTGLECDYAPVSERLWKGKKRLWDRRNLWQANDYYYEQQYEECSDLWQDDRPPGVLRQRLYPNSKYNKFEFRPKQHKANVRDWQEGMNIRGKEAMIKENPLGRTIRNVWCINPQAYSEAHFATYPEKLVEPLIKMAVPEQVCKKCGLGRKKVYSLPKDKPSYSTWLKQQTHFGKYKGTHPSGHGIGMGSELSRYYQEVFGQVTSPKIEVGLTDCGCKAGWRLGVVLDPFAGSCTTGLVAYRLRRDYVMIELSPEYVNLGNNRLKKEKEKYGLLERK